MQFRGEFEPPNPPYTALYTSECLIITTTIRKLGWPQGIQGCVAMWDNKLNFKS